MQQTALYFTASKKILLITVILSIILFAGSNLLFAAPKLSPLKRTEVCISNVKKSLKITMEQEEMWNDLVEIMRENAKEMEELIKDRADRVKTMSAVEDLKSYSEILDAHAEGMKRSIPAFEKLYDGMTDEQKEDADFLFKCYWHGKYGRTEKK